MQDQDQHPDRDQETARALLRLRTMTTGSSFDAAVSLYAQNAGPFVAIGAVILMPYIVLVVILAAVIVASDQAIIDRLALFLFERGLLGLDPVQLYFDLVAAGLALAVVLFFLVVEPIAAAALTVAVSRRYVNRPTSVGLVYRSILPRIGLLVLTNVWAALRLLPLLLACAVAIGLPPVCYLLVAWFFIVPIMALEAHPGSASKRSRELVRGDWWQTCGFVSANALLFLATLVVAALAGAIVAAMAGLTDPQPQAQVLIIVVVFVVTLALPVHVGATTLYYDGLKLRKDSGDLPAAP